MNQSIADQVKVVGIRAIAVNTTFQLAPWADMLYAADERWWRYWWERGASEFKGTKVCCETTAFNEVMQVRNTGPSGFDPKPDSVKTGSNSGYQAIHVAAHAGAARVLLCGFDMKGTHWHGKHPEPLRNLNEAVYLRWLGYFDSLAEALTKKGVEVVNCTPNSALKAFPFVPLEVALARAEFAKTASRLSA